MSSTRQETELLELKKREQDEEVKIKPVFYLPFCLYLKDGDYLINQNSEEIILFLKKESPDVFDTRVGFKPIIPSEIPDDETKYSGRDENGKGFREITARELRNEEGAYCIENPLLCRGYELKNDKKGYFRFTKATVTLSLPKEERMNFPYIKKKALEVINRLIEVYRFITGDYYIERLTDSDIIYMYGNIGEMGENFWVHKNLIPFQPEKRLEEHEKIKKYLINNEQIPVEEELLLNAKDFLLKENYRMTIIESVTALEPTVEDFVKNKLSSMKINKIGNFMNKVTLFPRVGVMLKLFIDPNQFKHTIIDEICSTINIRNKIVHKKKIRVEKGEAEKAVKNIENLINFLATIKMQKQQLREKIREEREREWIREALRARKFSGIETFEQGLSLIDFAMRIAKNAKHRKNT